MKTVYALSDSGYNWDRTFYKHVLKALGMENYKSEAALFFQKMGDKIIALWATSVDDSIHIDDSKDEVIVSWT